MTKIRLLAYDIETSPAIAYTWGLFNQNIGLSQLVQSPAVICFAARWLGSEKTMFFSDFKDGHEQMIMRAHELLTECDVLMGFNSRSFDTPHLMREFALAGLSPPAPFSEIDLYRTARRRFKFISNKLENIAIEFGLSGKVHHSGFELWRRCMAGDSDAWQEMEIYNRRDCDLLIELYDKLLPWIPNHPSRTLIDGGDGCPQCGGGPLRPRGFSYTAVSKFPRFRCDQCGKWLKGGHRAAGTDMRGVA